MCVHKLVDEWYISILLRLIAFGSRQLQLFDLLSNRKGMEDERDFNYICVVRCHLPLLIDCMSDACIDDNCTKFRQPHLS
jgi:hypothetical protein